MIRFFRYFTGFYRVFFASDHPEKILDFALRNNIPIWQIQRRENEIIFLVSRYHFAHFSPFFESLQKGESYRKEAGGTLRFFSLFSSRWALFAGAALFLFASVFSGFFVWGVEISGNQEISTEVIREKLSEAGLSAGKRIASIDPAAFSILFQIKNPEFSFVNLNFIGTKAVVEIREREQSQKVETEDTPTNLVASTWGKVVRVEVYEGQSEVKQGDSVTEGALLISGVREMKSGAFGFVHARGRVFAETNRSFEVFVPKSEIKTVYTGRESAKKIYEILGFRLCLDGVFRVPFSEYRTIETVETATIFGLPLPVRVREVIFLEIEEKNDPVELDTARNLAYDKYDKFIRENFTSDTEFLEENFEFTEAEDGIFLRVQMRLIENICKEIPFRCIQEQNPESIQSN